MAEKKDDEKEGRKEKKEASITASIFPGEMSADRRMAVNIFVSQGGKALEGRRVDVYFGDAMTSVGGLPMISDPMGKAGTVINVQAGIKGPQKIYAQAEGMPFPTSITVEIPEEEKKTQQVKYLSIESTWQGYDQYGNSMYQWILRLFDENNKGVAGDITISSENSIEINGEKKTKFTKGISDKEVDVYKIVISDSGTIEVDVFVHGCNIKREFQLRGKRVERTPGEPPAANANWWEKFKYGLKGGKL